MTEKNTSPGINAAESAVYRTEIIISAVLRTGVLASFLLIVAGMIISFIHHHEYLSSPAELLYLTHPGAAFPHTLRDVFTGLHEMRGQAVVTAGLLLLIVTPVMRVAVSIIIFLHKKDWVFTLITTVVLCLLLASFALGRIGR